MIIVDKGANLDVNLVIVDHDTLQRYDLTGASINFYVYRQKGSSEPPIISLSTPTDIAIINATNGEAVIHLQPSHTNSYDTGQYYYEIWLVVVGAQYLIGEGMFEIR